MADDNPPSLDNEAKDIPTALEVAARRPGGETDERRQLRDSANTRSQQRGGFKDEGYKPKSGIRRVNNLPLIIASIIVGIFILLIAMVAAKRANNSQVEQDVSETSNTNTDTTSMAMNIVAGRCTGLIPEAVPAAPAEPLPELPDLNELTALMNSMPAPPATLPDPSVSQPPPSAPEVVDPAVQEIRTAKIQRFQEAVRAKTAISFSNQLSSAPTNDSQSTRPQDLDYQKQMEAIQANLKNSQNSLRSSAASASNDRNNIKQFGQQGEGDRWQLKEQVQAPRSSFEIRAGGVIPGVMISGINSDLPGQIMGQVSQDVYDTATGKYLLIPQGTRLIGAYTNDVAYGQSAVMIAWQRLIFPDGKALDIDAMPGADNAGYSGFRDQVNNHYFRIFSSALLMSVVTAGISYSQDKNEKGNDGNNRSMNSQMSQALGQQFGQVITKMIEKNLDIAPTLEIRPGYRFNIMIIKDINFTKAYQSFDY
ncbi:TrbI/VirB10 family protein [Candidatus Regiella endosymbiont of Tuberolachnus salignus]|uniref:TrbI/VirB10 family protein n=1 Tax=Candidatus Regiella endosymbiont of Tuberolachnus salignus TaxID=3077956 RepID=UPI0030D04368